ncbi:MAG: hypothetical protein DME57_00215 [Verrucomicrobia bacterium]|nr:MAG: hypothetical protein DME57_00215 [Verrucomicrobiota bacterium]
MAVPIRVLTAVPICDGHDSAINTINLEFIRHGIEVVYLGYHRPVSDIVRAAIQEDVRAVGISSYNGGHIEFFAEVVAHLRKKGAGDIKVFGGGGGTITHDDAKIMRRRGVDEIFFAGTSLDDMVKFVHERYGKPRGKRVRTKSAEHELAHKLTEIEDGKKSRKEKVGSRKGRRARVIGFTGPGGAGKTTLIDELVLRFLNKDRQSRVAILSHDPSVIGQGALLGDRATMINSQHDRVFMRSMARAQSGRLRLRHHRDRGDRAGSDALPKKWDCRQNRARDESGLRQPFAAAEDRDARPRRHCGREQKRFAAREDRAHRNRAAARPK